MRIYLVLIFVLFCSSVLAIDLPAPPSSPVSVAVNDSSDLPSVVDESSFNGYFYFVLVVLLAILVAIIYLLRKYLNSKRGKH